LRNYGKNQRMWLRICFTAVWSGPGRLDSLAKKKQPVWNLQGGVSGVVYLGRRILKLFGSGWLQAAEQIKARAARATTQVSTKAQTVSYVTLLPTESKPSVTVLPSDFFDSPTAPNSKRLRSNGLSLTLSEPEC
jgi:hypothetical protein